MARSERIYNFTIGRPLEVSSDFFVPLKNENFPTIALEDYYNKDDPNAYLFDQHQIMFSVSKSSVKKETNSCKITLFNLDDDVVDYLEVNAGNNLVAILEAGDNETGLLTIFQGTVKSVIDNFTDQDRKTIIHMTDGGFNVQNAFTIRSYPRNTPQEQIITDLANDLKLPIQRISGITGNIQRPLSFIGNTIDILHKQVPSFFDANISIQNGAISVLSKNTRVEKLASFISQDTGLVGRVSAYTDDINSTQDSVSQVSKSITFTCLLDGNIFPDESIYVQDGKYDGAYKVVEVKYDGNYEGDSWYCNVVATETEEVIA